MQMLKQGVKHMLTEVVIDSSPATNCWAAKAFRNDAVDRSNIAVQSNSFFDNDHLQRVEDVRVIVNTFFPSKKAVYVNHRDGRGRPFSVVKVADIGQWPVNKNKQRDLYAPIEALGGFEVLLSKKTNSYLFRIR